MLSGKGKLGPQKPKLPIDQMPSIELGDSDEVAHDKLDSDLSSCFSSFGLNRNLIEPFVSTLPPGVQLIKPQAHRAAGAPISPPPAGLNTQGISAVIAQHQWQQQLLSFRDKDGDCMMR